MKTLGMLVLCAAQMFAGTRYYVKNGGSDDSTGTSDTKAWATISKVNSTAFVAGDTISFKCGSVWEESLTLSSSGSGTSGSRIIVNYYGTGTKPEITQLLEIAGSKTSGNWEDKGSNVWEFSGSVDNDKGWRVILDGRAYGHANEFAGINSRFRFFINGGVLRVYATSNPASFYSTIKMNTSNAIYLNGKDYITFRGLRISGGKKSVLSENSDYITFDSCNIGRYASQPAMMIGKPSDGTGPCDNWTLTADTLDRVDTVKYTFDPTQQTGYGEYNGWGDGIQVKDGTDGVVRYCVFRDLRHGSINLDAELNGQSTSNWLIERNEFYSRSDYNRPIDVHTYQRQTRNVTFRFNYIHNMTVHSDVMEISGNDGFYYYNILDSLYTPSWAVDAQHDQKAISPYGSGDRWSKNNLYANNTVMHADGAALWFLDWHQTNSALDSMKVYNNIFYENGNDNSTYGDAGRSDYQWVYGTEIYQQYPTTPFHADIRNNVVYNTKNSDMSVLKVPYGGYGEHAWTTVGDYNESDAAWEYITGNFWSNPSIGSNHKISGSSTARNAGIDWGYTGLDYFGNAIVDAPDAGAHEYTAETEDSLATVVSGDAYSVGSTTATVYGTVNPHSTSTTARVLYGLTTSYTDSTDCTENPITGTGGQSVSSALSGLSPSTTYHYAVAASNAAGYTRATGDSTFTTTSGGGFTVTTSCPVYSGSIGVAYSTSIASATGGMPPYTWSEGNPVYYGVDGLPDGLTISSGGMLTGTPTESGTFTFKIKATDSEVMVAVKTCSITIAAVDSGTKLLLIR